MNTFYLIDFENVHNEGIKNVDSLSKKDHVHIFTTGHDLKIRIDYVFSKEIEKKGIDIKCHIVPEGEQSLDMHLVSYLGYLLGVYGKQVTYVIVSKDKGYDNIISFWEKEGYINIYRKSAIPGRISAQSKTVSQNKTKKASENTQTVNSKISAGMDYVFFGDDRSELNLFMQHGLIDMGYQRNVANRVCSYVVAHCNDERMLSGIHNDLKREYNDCSEVYEDVKTILEKFVESKSKNAKREAQVRSFFGQHFKKNIYVENKENIISIILNAKTKQQVNNGLLKLYSDGTIVSHIYRTVQPLINDLPGK